MPPVDEQVLDEKRSDDQARAVGQISGPPQLPHAGVDDRIAGMPMRPGVEIHPRRGARESARTRAAARRVAISGWASSKAVAKSRQVSSARYFSAAPASAWLRRRRGFDRVRDAARRDLAETQIRRQARRGAMRKDVALVRVAFQRLRDEGLERGARACFAGRLAEAEFAGPVGLGGPKLQGFDRRALRRVVRPGRGGQAFGRRRRSGQGAERAMAAQEGLEDADRRPVGLGQFGWLAHQTAVESQRFDATRFERCLDARVERLRAAFVAAAPEDAAGVRRGGEREDRLLGVAFDDVEPRAASWKARSPCAVSDSASRHFAAPPSGRAPPPASSWI